MNEETLFHQLIAMAPAERAAAIERECADQPELRARIEALIAADDGTFGSLPGLDNEDPEFMAILMELTRISEPAEQSAYLDRVCAQKPGLRSRVDAYLLVNRLPEAAELENPQQAQRLDQTEKTPNSQFQTQAWPELPNFSETASINEAAFAKALPGQTSHAGELIGSRYTLLQLIGEGGMGSVYLASQTEPVRREVALKLIKTGVNSSMVLARFEAERQALAIMDHPNIARIYDGGVTPSGMPFFAMELVKGVSLTEYCDQRRLTVLERIRIFVQICNAVQHAHQKGIIHRDLKPSNILVTEVDGRPAPKIIDFGVAKATEQKLTDVSIREDSIIVGTPAYMSPEQADPSAKDIDTRTDVYALGVILYELLTGSPPIDAAQFRRGAILEMLRMVREVEPPRPSTRISSALALPNIASNRNIEPRQLTRLLQSELDWVVMKALEKDRDRRYDSANGLARDIERFLANEVVEARPPSPAYRLRKFVRRNRAQVITAGILLAMLMLGLVGTTLGLVEARKQEQIADARRIQAEEASRREGERAEGEKAERQRAEKAEIEAKRQTEEARRERDEAEMARQFLQFDILGQAPISAQMDRGFKPEPNLTVREALDRAAFSVGGKFPKAPWIEVRIRADMGAVYDRLGEFEKAIAQYRHAIEISRREYPMNNNTINMIHNFANTLTRGGKLEEAHRTFELVMDLERQMGGDPKKNFSLMNNYALSYQAADRHAEALKIFKDIHDELQKPEYAKLPLATLAIYNLGIGYRRLGQYQLAEPHLLKYRQKMLELNGPENAKVIRATITLCMNLIALGKPVEAVRELEAIRPVVFKNRAKYLTSTLEALYLLANTYGQLKRPEQLVVLEQLRDIQAEVHSPEHANTLAATVTLAEACERFGQYAKSQELFTKVRDSRTKWLGPTHSDTLNVQCSLAISFHRVDRHTEGAELFDKLIQTARTSKGPSDNFTIGILVRYLMAIEELSLWERAANLRAELVAAERPIYKPDDVGLGGTLSNLGYTLLQAGRFKDAESVLRESLTIRLAKSPGLWSTWNTEAMLGGALLGQKKYAEAEQHLLRGYEGLKAQEKLLTPGIPRIANTLDRLILLYIATKKPEEVIKWRSERSKYPPEQLPRPRAVK